MLIKLIIYNNMKKILTLLTICIVGLTSCKEEEITQESFISIYPTELIFDADGGEQSITINCADSWQLSGSADWCNVSSTYGKNGDYVYFSVDKSQDTDEKSVTYTFRSGTSSQELTVIQKQKDALTITTSNFEVPAEGQEISIEVKANIDFNYEITSGQEWIHRVETKTMETTVLNFIVDKNIEFEDRTGEIDINSGDITEHIKIHQTEAVPNICISKTNYDVSAAGETIIVEIDANVDFSYRFTPDVEWVHIQEIDAGVEFEIEKNNLLESREVQVEFYNEEYGLSSAIKITQNAYGLEDMLQTVHVASKGSLSNVLSENGIDNPEYLKITGELNDVDFLTLNEIGKNNLMYLDISEVNITVIPNNAMNGTNLSYIILPKNLIEIGAGAFYGTNIKEINIPETVEIIGKSAFSRCDALSKANIPTKIKEMGSYVFYYCTSLQEDIIIPPTIESIGDYIFEGSAIQSVTFKKGETPISITYCMFRNCKSLSSVNFETGCLIQELESGCFAECTALSEITIPAEVSEIVSDAFRDCTSLKSVTFETGSKLTTIDGYFNISQYGGVSISGAFKGCTSLSSITIPASVETIVEGAFYDCTSLKEVKFEEGSKLSEIGGRASYNAYDYNNHAGKRWFSAGAFENCSALTSITIPKEVMEIKPATFKGCSSLSEIKFEKGSKLQRISSTYYFHESSTLNGPNPFDGCPLKIFDASNCTELATLEQAPFDGCNISLFKIGTATPPESEFVDWYIGRDIGTTSYAILKVPDESVSRYKNSYWSDYFPSISGLSE